MAETHETELEGKAKPETIEVTVTFPLAQGKPFHAKEKPEKTVGSVLKQAMEQFGINEEPNSSYYLTHGGARVDDGATLSSVAGETHVVKFTLVKELVQG